MTGILILEVRKKVVKKANLFLAVSFFPRYNSFAKQNRKA